ncbi:hypothetical protein ACQKKX_07645 [Neorhizobium sp. NPDC001467]|uniref:hypothetical protein n=1 Tax=Neorhizobium sp. NPDC001467 TaxID=3390595 RepID=UPI003D00A7F8
MSTFTDTEIALMARLRVLKAEPEKTINLTDILDPLIARGFSKDGIFEVLAAVEQDGTVALVPGDRLRILKPLTE